MARLRFGFSLTRLDQVAPWGEGALHWFGLTDGSYWIDVGDHQLLRPEGEPWVDYYLARFWEDLCLLAPVVLEPVPADLVEFLLADVEADEHAFDDPDREAALSWRSDHFLDFGYLEDPPRSLWWRTGDEITLTWSHQERPLIRETVPVAEFRTALADLDRDLMIAMNQRVSHIEANGAPNGTRIDVGDLRREHVERSHWLDDSTKRLRHTDWAAVRAGARRLLS